MSGRGKGGKVTLLFSFFYLVIDNNLVLRVLASMPVVLSVIAKSSVITSRVSPSLPFVFLPVVVVCSVFRVSSMKRPAVNVHYDYTKDLVQWKLNYDQTKSHPFHVCHPRISFHTRPFADVPSQMMDIAQVLSRWSPLSPTAHPCMHP
jgi:hypothetical protein